jgi:cyclohexa-1,5-dienecarbonyl-CoA hydratase
VKEEMAAQLPATFSRIKYEAQPPVARVSLHNPPHNIIDLAMMEELAQTLAEIESRSDISLLVLTGLGKNFSAGVDVAAHAPDQVEATLSKFHAVIRALVGMKKVSIAAVQGYCLGGGAELAMVCDLAYTTELAQWGFPEIKLGCYPPVAVTALAAVVGQKHAADLILTGRSITGSEAEEIGLVNRAVPEGQLTAAVEEPVQRLAQMSPAVLGITKKATYAWDSIHFDKGLARAERIYLEELVKTEDTREGVRAFLQKREPRWKGK